MDGKILAFLAPVITAVLTYHLTRRNRKNDLETKLTQRIQDLTCQILDLNKKYIETIREIRILKHENEELKQKLENLLNKRDDTH